jgi:hypothetical protein
VAPADKTHVYLGPPKAHHSSDEPSSESESDSELVGKPGETTGCVVLFINEANLISSPQMNIKVSGKFNIIAIVDSGTEVNLLSERVYEEPAKTGLEIPVLPVENVILVTAFGRRSKRIRRQALLEFSTGHVFETVVMISAQLANDAIIGCQFLKEYGFRINFDSETFTYVREGISREQTFAPKAGSSKACSDDRRVIWELTYTKPPYAGQQPSDQTADRATPPSPPRAADSCKGFPTYPTIQGREAPDSARPGPRVDKGSLHLGRDVFPDPGAEYARWNGKIKWVPINVVALRNKSPAEILHVQAVTVRLLH